MKPVVETVLRYGDKIYRVGDLVTVYFQVHGMAPRSVAGIIRKMGESSILVGDTLVLLSSVKGIYRAGF